MELEGRFHEKGMWANEGFCARQGWVLSRSGGEKGLRGSGAGTLGVPLGLLNVYVEILTTVMVLGGDDVMRVGPWE